jgi:RimJ/RimL family protein N-acetyltransferase
MDANGMEVVAVADAMVLRHYRTEDAEDLATGCNDPLVRRFVPAMPSPYTRHDALAWIGESSPPGVAGNFAFAFADPHTDRLLGGGGFRRAAELTAEVGYWVAPWARRRGVATAAARLLTAHAFGQGVERVSLRTEWENTASQRAALAAGFTREGVQRLGGASRDGTRHDLIVWVRLHTDPAGPTQRVLPDLPGYPTSGRGELSDGVVTLRPLGPDDVEESYELRSLPDIIATSVPPQAPDRDRIERSCTRAEAGWLAGERADFTIRDTATSAYAGEIGLYYWEPGTGQAMIGYSMMPEWRGKGYATRAARLVTAWAFDVVGVPRVIAGTAPENLGSQRVLERAGFVREGYQRSRLPGPNGTRIDDILYAQVRPLSPV